MNSHFWVNFPFKLSSTKGNPGQKNKHWTLARKLLMGFEKMFDVLLLFLFFSVVSSLKFHVYLNPPVFSWLKPTAFTGARFET